mmetsp:Transcript_16209/g.22838  ORF Transcript_16209/g.22838 Transcript_16209/m.22838 type:complete len:222 (+) Transcript_16209:2210-2875(+)
MAGRMRKMKSSAVSVADDTSFRRAFSFVMASCAVSKTSLTFKPSICFITTSLVIPAFWAISKASSTTLFPDTPSSASRTSSLVFMNVSPAATTSSLLRILTVSFKRAVTVSSPEIIFRTCCNALSMEGSVTDDSALSSCFSISLAAFRAIGSKSADVPPSPFARAAISSGDSSLPKCDFKSHKVRSIRRRATSLYSLRSERTEISVSLASLVAEVAEFCKS